MCFQKDSNPLSNSGKDPQKAVQSGGSFKHEVGTYIAVHMHVSISCRISYIMSCMYSVCIYIIIYIYMYAHTLTYIYIYIYTCIYIYIYTYTYTIERERERLDHELQLSYEAHFDSAK